MINCYNYPFVKSVVVCGDIHGEFETLVYNCCFAHKMRDTLVIVAGDCGFGFHSPRYYMDELLNGRLYRKLEEANVPVAFVRGNHDDPFYFTTKCISSDCFRAIEDYSVITACGHQILCVGGAVSIDRDSRTELKDWWMNEGPVLRHDLIAEIARNGFRIDTVITHTAPSFCERLTPPAGIGDAVLLADLRHERNVMDGLLESLHHDGHPVRHWYYGHFHSSWNAIIDGIEYTMLDCLEMKGIKR